MADEIRLASRRERHKDQRRNRIIDAAYELMREAGADDISVKMISDRADVSTATLYNLFGTKGAVLEKVYERDMAQFAVKLAAAKAPSALDEIFAAVRTGIDLFRTDPNFYRGLSIRNPRAEPELVASVQDPRQQLWIGLLERAIAERDLAADTRVELVSMAMLHLGGGAFSAWCADL